MLLTKLLYRKVVLHIMSQCNLSYLSCLPKKDSRKALLFTYNRLNMTE